MKPQFSWADTDVAPTAANRAAAAIAIVGCFIDMEAYSLLIVLVLLGIDIGTAYPIC
jgi:hypothetical protein